MSIVDTGKSALLVLLFAVSGCVLGDEGSMLSPYTSAYFELSGSEGVADGRTPVTVLVRGEAGSTLTLLLRSAEFVGGSTGSPLREKTVQLVAPGPDEEGLAEVLVVSNDPGLATVSFKVAPLASSLEIAFAPIAVTVGKPRAIEVWPGEVAHQLCIYANTLHGALSLGATAGALVPNAVELVPTNGGDSECSETPPSMQGVARVQWVSSVAADLEVHYTGARGEPILVHSSNLRGEAFPGYDVGVSSVDRTDSWTRLEVQLFYRETLSVAASPASSVSLGSLRSVPEGGRLVGSSSGGEEAIPQTDADGWVALYFENAGRDSVLSVFATPTGGGTLFLGDLPVPD